MFVKSLVYYRGDSVVPPLEIGTVYGIVKEDKLHYFIMNTITNSAFGFFKEKFEVLKGDEKTLKLLYLKENYDNL